MSSHPCSNRGPSVVPWQDQPIAFLDNLPLSVFASDSSTFKCCLYDSCTLTSVFSGQARSSGVSAEHALQHAHGRMQGALADTALDLTSRLILQAQRRCYGTGKHGESLLIEDIID